MPEDEKFLPWRKFITGGVDLETLFSRLRANSSVSNFAKHLMGNEGMFSVSSTEQEIETIVLTPADFGYRSMPKTIELFDSTRLTEWSRQNRERLPKDRLVALLPIESGPHIRIQYADQPKSEVLVVTAESAGYVFTLGCHDTCKRWLDAEAISFFDLWKLNAQIVYRLRKVA
jgi:hypothetical protein